MRLVALAALGAWLGIAAPATAGNYDGDTLVRVQGTVVIPDSSADVKGSPIPGASADVSTEVIPTLTITHFFTKNVAAELFCCFGRFNVEGRGTVDKRGESRRLLGVSADPDAAIPLRSVARVQALHRRGRAIHGIL